MSEEEAKLSETIQKAVDDLLFSLKSDSKLARRKALEKFHDDTLEKDVEIAEYLKPLYAAIFTQVLRSLSDEAEACRAAAAAIVDKFVKRMDMSDYQLTYIMPALVKRLGQPEIVEDSEELRLVFLQLVRSIIARNNSAVLEPFINDFTSILCKTVQDPFPEARIEAAACVEDLTVKIPRLFYMQSESYVKPLLPSLAHQRFKVRVAAVRSLGAVVMAGQSRCLELAVTPLAEKLFDEVAAVRRQVTREVGRWMLHQRDRYSYWHRMLPIILTGLSDANDDIRKESAETWDQIGFKFMEENEEDLKKYTEFLANDVPPRYPKDVPRPNLGCRTLVVRNIGKILPAVARECGGWQADARYRVVQLLRWLLLCAECGATQNSYLASDILQISARDEDPRVVYEMQIAASYYGMFIDPETWWPLLRPRVDSWSTVMTIAYIALGTGNKFLDKEAEILKEIMCEVADPDNCETRKEQHQKAFLTLCDNLMQVLATDSLVVKNELFTVVFTVYTIAEGDIKQRAKDVLRTLSTTCGYGRDNLCLLYSEHVVRVLHSVRSDPLAWSVASPHYCLLYAVLTEFGNALSVATAELAPLLRRVLTEPKLDAKVKVKLYNALSMMLIDKKENFSGVENDAIVSFYRSIREDLIMPQLVWQPGMTAESVRCAAVSCLCCLLQADDGDGVNAAGNSVDIMDTSETAHVTSEVVAAVPSLLDDRCELTRRRALTVVEGIATLAHRKGLFSVDHLHKMYFAVVKRLDDSSGQVRSMSARALVELFRRRPTDYDRVQYGAHIEAVYTTMLVHLDDPDEAFRNHVLHCLQELNDLDPELLLKKLKANLPLYKNKEAFETLQESLSKMAIKC